jgi:hypothetical protein
MMRSITRAIDRPAVSRRVMLAAAAGALLAACGCAGEKKPIYGVERPLAIAGARRQTWAVAPVIDLSGQRVDPILQADLLYQQLQQVDGLTVIPVNRVVQVYTSLRIAQVQSEEQAAIVCDLLNCDSICVATISAYDPYEPPKFGAAIQVFRRDGVAGGMRPAAEVDPRQLVRRASPLGPAPAPASDRFVQVVGMYDAANGSTREELFRYAQGRSDPVGPLKERTYLVEMDRFCGFVYTSLIEQLLRRL